MKRQVWLLYVHNFPTGVPFLGVITSTGTLLGSFVDEKIIFGVSYRGTLGFIQCSNLLRYMVHENRRSSIQEHSQSPWGRFVLWHWGGEYKEPAPIYAILREDLPSLSYVEAFVID